jgi:hypothetical protein
MLQVTQSAEKVRGNTDRQLTGAVVLDVAKAFDTVRANGILHNHFQSLILKFVSQIP